MNIKDRINLLRQEGLLKESFNENVTPILQELVDRDLQELKEMPSILDEIEREVDEEKAEKIIKAFSTKENLAEQIIDSIPLYYDNSCLWWKWNFCKKKWEIIDEVDLMNLVAGSSYANTINSKERGEILQALKQQARIKRPKEAPITWIQFGEEVIDYESGLRFKASPEYFLTNPLPYKLGKSTDTPNIDKIMGEWVGGEKIKILKEIIATCMIRHYPLHRLFCLIGAGSNGKSCFLRILKNFVGMDNICSTELDVLMKSRFEVTKLHKKLVCQMGETNFSEINKTSILKKLTGEDTIGFEYKNKTPFDDINYAKIILATNNLPTTDDKSLGFYRRWIIIAFPNQFDEKKDILSDIPSVEYENLGLQLIDILNQLLKKREYAGEGSIEERKKRYEDYSDPLEKFMREYTEEDAYTGYIWKWEFEKRLNEWCRENRHREMSEVVIGRKMKQKGIEQQQKYADWMTHGSNKGARAWIGIKWKGEQTG